MVSRLTSLVAVDVTPSRPVGEEMTTSDIPLNLPKGWDFEKIFGKDKIKARTIRTDAGSPGADAPDQWASIQAAPVSPALAAAQRAKGIALPQGATMKDLERVLGLLLIIAAMLVLFGTRFLSPGVKEE